MNSDVVALIGVIAGAIGSVGGVGAWIVAMRANRRADRANTLVDEANSTAKAALDLQARIDEREREYRDVVLWGEWANRPGGDELEAVFVVRNDGLTTACSVTLALSHNGIRECHDLGDIYAQEEVRVTISSDTWIDENGRERIDQRVFDRTGYRLHWSSLLGQVSSVEVPVPPDPQIF